MGLLDAFKKKRTEIVRDNKGNFVGTVKTDMDISKYLGIFDSRVRNQNYIALFSEVAEIQFPVRAITERALKAEFTLKYYNSDKTEWHNDAIKKFLSQPNETDTFYEFFSKIIAYYLVTGNAYVYSNSPSLISSKIERWRRTDDYYVLPADKTNIVYQDRQKLFQGAPLSETVRNYTVSTEISNMEFSPENILNIRDMKLAFDNRTMEGQSRIDSLKYPVSNLIAAYEARNAIFVKCGALGMFIDGNELIYRKREKSFNKSIQAIELSEEDCADLKTGIEKDFLFSGLKIGYKKKDYENTNGRFEFNGQHDYSSDYTGGSTKILELISPFRADCYGIEFLAQERGKDTKDDKSDKDLFMVNVWKEFGE